MKGSQITEAASMFFDLVEVVIKVPNVCLDFQKKFQSDFSYGWSEVTMGNLQPSLPTTYAEPSTPLLVLIPISSIFFLNYREFK